MYSSAHLHVTCFRMARSKSSWSMLWWVGTGLKHTLLCPSPLAEPAERISRNGLPRLHSLDGSQTVGWRVDTA
jgi:hypothetical protein